MHLREFTKKNGARRTGVGIREVEALSQHSESIMVVRRQTIGTFSVLFSIGFHLLELVQTRRIQAQRSRHVGVPEQPICWCIGG